MPQFKSVNSLNSLSTTSVRMAAIRLKSANKSIFRALLSLASAALLTRMFGMLNQVIVTSHFGAGSMMDAFFVASSVPTLMALLIGSAVESSVIPAYTHIRSQGNKKQASLLFSTLLNILIAGAILLTVVMLIFSRQIILLSAPGLDPFRIGLAADLAPFIYPALVLMVVIGFLECILNAEGQFGWPAYAGLLVPFTTAILVLVAGKSQGIVMLCVGMLAGLCLQLGVVILRAKRAGLVYRPILNLHMPEISSILLTAWPVLIGSLISQGSPLVDQIFASSLSAGNISALNYAIKLISVPTGVIFVSVGRAALPYLSRQARQNDMKAFKETLRLYLWSVGIGTTILSIFMLVLAHPIVQILFQRGAFSPDDTNRTTNILIGFTIGLTPMAFGFITAKAFSALGKTRILMYSTTFTVIANAVFDYIFARLWQGFGISLATSAVYFCTMFILLFTLSRVIGKLNLFTPPQELLNILEKVKTSTILPQQVARIAIVLTVFAAGVVGVLQQATYTLSIAFGSIIMLFFIRYRYVLLIAWVMIDVFIGSTVSFFNGNHFDIGLTAPTLILMICLPIGQTLKRVPMLIFLLAFLLWALAGIGIAPFGISIFLTRWLLRLDWLAVSILTIQVLISRERLMRLIDIILGLCAIISLYGIYGYFVKQNGIGDSSISSLYRIASVFGVNPPTLALFLSLIIPLTIFRIFTLRGSKKVIAILLALLYLVTLVLTFTRTSLVSVPISIVVMCFFLPSRKLRAVMFRSVLVLGLVAILATIVFQVPLFQRFFSQDVTTLNNRTYYWQAVLNNFNPTKILGNGLDASFLLPVDPTSQAPIVGPLYDPNTYHCLAAAGCGAHNLFLGILYDHGIIGLALFIGILVTLLINILMGARKASSDHRILYGAVLAALINMLAQCLDSTDLLSQNIGIYFWIIVALPFALCWQSTCKPSGDEITYEITNEETIPQLEIIQMANMR